MKASELNGTHLGQRITFTENGVSATGVLARVDHAGQIITDRPAMLEEQEVLGRIWVHLEFLGAMQANVTPAAEVTIHEPIAGKSRGGFTGSQNAQHWLTEDHNADPKCACGWVPENMWPREMPLTHVNGRELVRRHLRAQEAPRED